MTNSMDLRAIDRGLGALTCLCDLDSQQEDVGNDPVRRWTGWREKPFSRLQQGEGWDRDQAAGLAIILYSQVAVQTAFRTCAIRGCAGSGRFWTAAVWIWDSYTMVTGDGEPGGIGIAAPFGARVVPTN